MKLGSILGALTVSFILVANAQAADRFDPRSLKGQIAGPPSEILVLGTAHLRELPANYKPEYLAPVLDRLAAWRPQIITVEALSGPDCDMLMRYKAVTPGVADQYCWDTDAAKTATGLDVPAAEAKVEALLAAWPANPTAAQRRQLAATFLAANDRPSAFVQWLRLPPAERHEGDELDKALVGILTTIADTGVNENYRIAAALAARLGLERIYLVDDHSADRTEAALGADFEKAITALWAGPNPERDRFKAKAAALNSGAVMLAFYRYLNDPAVNRASILADMGAALKQDTPQLFGRQYVAWWETRNLRMVANIRAAFARIPGARVLCVVGATHKAYFESYLDMMSEVRIVDAQQVLR